MCVYVYVYMLQGFVEGGRGISGVALNAGPSEDKSNVRLWMCKQVCGCGERKRVRETRRENVSA